jgi:hypothetical protein
LSQQRKIRWGGLGIGLAAFLIVAIAVGFMVARTFFHGEKLARFVEHQINTRIRGRVEIGTIEWSYWDIHALLTGAWMTADLYGVKVFDAEGVLVIDAPHARGKVDVQGIVFNRNFYFDDITLPKPAWTKIREELPPGADPETASGDISLLTAFYSNDDDDDDDDDGDDLSPWPTWSLGSFRADALDLEFEFRTFEAHVKGASGSGWLYYAKGFGPPDEAAVFTFAMHDVKAQEGDVTILGVGPVYLRDLKAPVLQKREPGVDKEIDASRDVEWRGSATTTEGAHVEINGRLVDYWRSNHGGLYDCLVMVDNAGPVAQRLTDGIAGGDDMRAMVLITDSRWAPNYRFTIADMDTSLVLPDQTKPIALHVDSATVTYSVAAKGGLIHETTARGAGGAVQLRGAYAVEPLALDAEITVLEPLDGSPWISRQARDPLGGAQIGGSFNLLANEDRVRLEKLAVSIGKTNVRGTVEYLPEHKLVTARPLEVTQGSTFIRTNDGRLNLSSGALYVPVQFGSGGLESLLRRLDQPVVAQRGSGRAVLEGTLDDPRVRTATVALGGVPVVDQVKASMDYRGGILRVDQLTSALLGAPLNAHGRVRLRGRPEILDARASVLGLELSEVPGTNRAFTGSAHLHATAKGLFSAPISTFGAEVDELRIMGEEYTDFELTGSTDQDGSANLVFHIDRRRGGRLDVNATLGSDQELGGVISVREIPIHSLPGVADPDGRASFGAMVNAELRLGGTLRAPVADGRVTASRGWFKDAFLGSASLSLETTRPGQMRLSGNMFQGKFKLNALVDTYPTPQARLSVAFSRLEIDQFFPELTRKFGVRGWLSGRIDDLVVGKGQRSSFQVTLTELVVLMDTEDDRGRPRPIRIRNRDDVVVISDGTSARLVNPVMFEGPTGNFVVSGTVDPDALAVKLKGTVDVALLSPYLKTIFEESRGTVTANVDVTGTIEKPRVTGIVELEKIVLRPTGQDAEIRVPLAKIQVTNEQILFTGFTIQVYDEITEETDELNVMGGIQLASFVPNKWGLTIYGTLPGKLLLVAAPSAFTAASGSATVELTLEGEGIMPDIGGSLSFKRKNPLTFTPRGLRREILLSGGEIAFEDQNIEFVQVSGSIDDSGRLLNVSGEVSLANWEPSDLDIRIDAEAIPFRIPRVLELELDVRGLRVVGDTKRLEVIGSLDVVDGRYIQKFNPILNALRPERVQVTEKPFYKESPLLANARLDLTVTTGGGFGIKNNIANIDLNGEVRIAGTPARPLIDGAIQVKHGWFKFQGMRTAFENTEGNIVFSRFKTFPTDSPSIDIQSGTTYIDTRGQDHDVVLKLTGRLSEPNWDLYTTNTGLNKSQTFTLLFAGRTTEETRSLLGDDPVAPTGNFERNASTANTEGQLDAFDQLAKDYLGDFISVLVEEPLRNATGFDIVRIEVGTSGVGGRIEERVGNASRFVTEFERTLNGYTVKSRLEHRLLDDVAIEFEWLYKQFFDDADEDLNAGRVKGVVRGKKGE